MHNALRHCGQPPPIVYATKHTQPQPIVYATRATYATRHEQSLCLLPPTTRNPLASQKKFMQTPPTHNTVLQQSDGVDAASNSVPVTCATARFPENVMLKSP